jgi:hypothetical protein
VYGWIWQRLPGNWIGKVAGCAVLLAAAVAVLFLVVFPYAEPRLPFNQVTVDPGGGSSPGIGSVPPTPPPSTPR